VIQVEEIPLDIIFPDNGIGVVTMQPFVELNDSEPFQWLANKKQIQIDRIVRTLEISKNADHGCEKTHFTVFPEYSIPGLDGVQRMQALLEDGSWQNGTFVIGGIDGLTKEAYVTLCGQANTTVNPANQPDKVRDGQWINCAIVWSKQNGIVSRWLQPKIIPAAQEELCPASHMFEGRSVYIFKPQISLQGSLLSYRFFCLICKDWIGNIGALRVIDDVLAEIDRNKGNTDRLDIYLSLILKRNLDPDYPLFLQTTEQYLNENTSVGIRRAEGAVFFVNNAGKEGPGHCASFGKSGFVFHPNCSFVTHEEYCPPTYTLKKRDGFATCKEARFRENGSCITSFRFIPPIHAIVRRIPATTKIPINPAIVHSIEVNAGATEIDPRTPGAEVPASIKWANDCLDRIDSLLEHQTGNPLRNEIKSRHDAVSKEIRKSNHEFICRCITMASCGIQDEASKWTNSKAHNIDNWDEQEKRNFETVVHSLSVIRNHQPIEINSSPTHGTIKIQDKVIDIIVVFGKSHEECREYAKAMYRLGEQRFVIVITRDINGSSVQKKFGSFLEIETELEERGPIITDPNRRFIYCGYQNLIDCCFHSPNLTELERRITGVLGV